jgi:hypothetical protein
MPNDSVVQPKVRTIALEYNYFENLHLCCPSMKTYLLSIIIIPASRALFKNNPAFKGS